jgi:hypothetical protein
MINKWSIAIGVAALAVLALVVYRSVTTGPRLDGTCRAIATAAGVGDISVDQARGIAYLAYLDRAPDAQGKQPVGTIMLVDLNAKEPRVRAALNSDPPDFRPQALSLYAPAQGARRLFVVDAGKGSTSIQVLEQSTTGAFSLVKLVRDSRLVNPSAIVAAGPDQFYVLNPSAWWQLGAPSVAYYDGQRMTSVTADKAKEIAAATSLAKERHADAAAKYGKSVLIGSLTRHELALCESAD